MKENRSHASRRRATVLLLFSLCVNLVLVVAAAHRFAPLKTQPTVAAGQKLAPRDPGTNNSNAAVISVFLSVTNTFHWRLIESTNYEEYVANLHAVGCPEKTIRDILVADVGERYKNLKTECELNQPFWAAGRERWKILRQSQKCVAVLEQEQVDLLQRLLGFEVFPDNKVSDPNHVGELAVIRYILGPMTEEKFQKVLGILARYEKLKEHLTESRLGIATDEDEEAMWKLGAEQGRDLAAILSPLEFEEIAARVSGVSILSRNFFREAGLTAADIRAICLAKARAHEFATLFDFSEEESEALRAKRDAAFTNAVAQSLGPEKLDAYERAVDVDFHHLCQLTKDNNLPQAAAMTVYEIRRAARDEMRQLRAETDLDDSVRKERIAEIQAGMEAAALRALGEAAFNQYLNRGDGTWLTNTAGL